MSDLPAAPIPENLRELVNAQLMDDETIQWIDQPIPVFYSESMLLFLLGIFTIQLVAIFLVFAVNGHGAVFWENLLGCIGFSFLMPVSCGIGAWIGIRQRSKQTVYVITNFRAIIIRKIGCTLNVTSYYPKELFYLSRTQRMNGTGCLYFQVESWRIDRWLKGGFMNICNVQEVERMLQELKRTKSPE